MTTQITYSEEFNKHDNIGHPENSLRLTTMINDIKKQPFYERLEFVEPKILSEENLKSVHSEEMIQIIKQNSISGETWIDLDTYVCQSDYDTARLAAGSLVQLCQKVIYGEADNAYALIRPPGHHATKNRSMGFCLFNNAAIAANEIAKTGRKILIFDNDVHHGNGTQEIFYDRDDVMYQSIHLYPHYPGTGDIDEKGINKGEGYTINAPLSHGNGDKAVSNLLKEIFIPVAEQFKPDLIIFSTGFDSHHFDPLGGLKLSANFYGKMIAEFQKIQPRIVNTLEGGYNLGWIGKCLSSQLAQMTSQKIIINDPVEHSIDNSKDVIKKIKEEIKDYWDV